MTRSVSDILAAQPLDYGSASVVGHFRHDLNSRRFVIDDGRRIHRAHVGHIFYDNKLGLGDGVTGLRELDWTLTGNADTGTWGFQFHSFHPSLPRYADGLISFRDVFKEKDQTVQYQWIGAAHVEGQLLPYIDGVTDTNCVLYPNAFGDGKDLIITFSRSKMRMLVRIRAGFYSSSSNESFDVKAILPNGVEVWRAHDEKKLTDRGGYKLEMRGSKVISTDKKTLIGNPSIPDSFTHLFAFKAWDSAPNRLIEDVGLTFKALSSNEMMLTKSVGPSFFSKAYGDVFIDPTTSYYAGAGDGIVQATSAVHATARGAASGTKDDTTTEVSTKDDKAGDFFINHSFIPADTSGIGASNVPSAGILYVYTTSAGGDADSCSVAIVQTTQASNTALANDDFDQCGSLNTPTEGATRKAFSAISTGQYNSYTLNASGVSWISTTSYTKLGMRDATRDIDNSAPTGRNYSFWNTSETASTTSDPYLDVTYAPIANGGMLLFF